MEVRIGSRMMSTEPGSALESSAEGPVPLLHGALLSLVRGVAHGFSTREGGVSEGSLGPLNLARRPEEREEALVENWRRVVAALAPGLAPERVAIVHQVHGADVLRVSRGRGPLAPMGEADALITTEPGLVLAVRTADCVPVLMAAPGGVAAAHAGWRGTVAGVVPAAVQALCEATGAPPARVVAAIGPHISGAAYEVGPEVVEGLRRAGVPEASFLRPGPGPRDHVDLGGAVEAQLRAAGVLRIDRVAGCTFGEPRFHSHRRDGAAAGRQAGLIARWP